jgi:hypothetical protein
MPAAFNLPATEISVAFLFTFISVIAPIAGGCEGDAFRPKQSPNYEEIASSLSLLAMTPSKKEHVIYVSPSQKCLCLCPNIPSPHEGTGCRKSLSNKNYRNYIQ